MGSKGIKQNLGAVVNKNVVRPPHVVGIEQREAAHKKMLEDAGKEDEMTRLRLMVDDLGGQVTQLQAALEEAEAQLQGKEEELATMKDELKRAYGDQNKSGDEPILPDVIKEDDLELKNKPATARQLPQEPEEVEMNEEEEDSEEESSENEATA